MSGCGRRRTSTMALRSACSFFRGCDGLDKGDLPQADRDVVDRLIGEPAHLDVDRQLRGVVAGSRAPPEGRHETPFSKKLEHPGHNSGLSTCAHGKASGDGKVMVSDRCGEKRHEDNPRQQRSELTKP